MVNYPSWSPRNTVISSSAEISRLSKAYLRASSYLKYGLEPDVQGRILLVSTDFGTGSFKCWMLVVSCLKNHLPGAEGETVTLIVPHAVGSAVVANEGRQKEGAVTHRLLDRDKSVERWSFAPTDSWKIHRHVLVTSTCLGTSETNNRIH